MTKIDLNSYNTRDLVLNIMERVARVLDIDTTIDAACDALYDICCDLEDYPEDCGFGSSDAYGYIQHARRYFHMPAERTA